MEVLGKSAWFACGTCPEELRKQRVVLKSSDGENFTLSMEELWFARKTARRAMESASRTPIPVPFRKGIVAKLVEYFRHHKDIPPSEIHTPLASENLAECGASKWDANYISVERDVLFDLMVAASVLDIPSLLFLAAAKAASLVRDRSPEKLLKDFKLTNDLPKEESSALDSSFIAEQTRRGVKADDTGIGGVAMVLNSVLQAANKAGVIGKEDGPTADALKSFRLASWRAMVLADWKQLGAAPVEAREDRSLVSAAIDSSCGQALQFASHTLKKDKKLVLQAVQLNGNAMKHADGSLKGDRAFVAEALALSGEALEHANLSLKSDQDLILKACANGRGSALKGAGERLKSNASFVLQCAALHGEAIKYAKPELLESEVFMVEVATKNGLALQHMLPKFKANSKVVHAAVASNPGALTFAHTCVRAELGRELPQDSAPKLAAMKKEQDEAGFDEEGIEIKKAAPLILGPFHSRSLSQKEQLERVNLSCRKVMNTVQFSALSTMFANMGQANYVAANSFLDKLPFYQRPQVESLTLMWGAVGNVGMRWKAFASADMLNANPDALLDIDDARKVLKLTCTTYVGLKAEWCAASFFDEATKSNILRKTAGAVEGWQAGWPVRGGEDARAFDDCSAPARELCTWSEPGPLGGWPELNSQQEGTEGGEPRQEEPLAKSTPLMQLVPDMGLELSEGASHGGPWAPPSAPCPHSFLVPTPGPK